MNESNLGAGVSKGIPPNDLKNAITASFNQWFSSSVLEIHEQARNLSDDEWFEVVLGSVDGKLFAGQMLPAFVSADSQSAYVGSSGQQSLKEAIVFLRVILDYARKEGVDFSANPKVADFGAGWGRYTRFLLKYTKPDNIYGLEVNEYILENTRKTFGACNLLKVNSYPPCDLRDNLIDLVLGYSVFSHLSPDCADAWIGEFARIVRPGGLVMMTTQGRTFVEYCQYIRDSGNITHPWHNSLAKSFVNVQECLEQYDNGGFLHAQTGQYDGTYGESLVSPGYIKKNWVEYFDLIDFFDDRSTLPQALFVLKRNRKVYSTV